MGSKHFAIQSSSVWTPESNSIVPFAKTARTFLINVYSRTMPNAASLRNISLTFSLLAVRCSLNPTFVHGTFRDFDPETELSTLLQEIGRAHV